MSKKAKEVLFNLGFDDATINAIMSDDPNADSGNLAQVFLGGQFELFKNHKDYGGKIKNETRKEVQEKNKKSLIKEFGLNVEDEGKEWPELLLESKKAYEKSVSEKYANLTDTEAKVELKNMKIQYAKLEDEIKQLKEVEIPLQKQTAENHIKQEKFKEKLKKHLLKGVEFGAMSNEAFEEKYFDLYYRTLNEKYDVLQSKDGEFELWDKSGDGKVYDGAKPVTPKMAFLKELEADKLLKQGVSNDPKNPPVSTPTQTTQTNKQTVVVENNKPSNMLAPQGEKNAMYAQIEAAKALKNKK